MPEVTSVTRLTHWPKDVRPEAERGTPRPVTGARVTTVSVSVPATGKQPK